MKGVGQYFDLAPCLPHEKVCDRAAEEEPDFFFVYDTFFPRLPLQLPLSSFACNVLSALRIAPTQLLPNGWSFVYAFECLCRYLSILPSTPVFFNFFQVNRSTTPKGVTWASIHGVANRSLLMPFSSSFKNFKDCFLKVLVKEDFPELILSQRGWLRFPFYWKSHHVPTTQKKLDGFESWEQSHIAVLEAFPVVSTAAILECRDSSSLFQYLGNLNDFSCFFENCYFRLVQVSYLVILSLQKL